MRRIKAYLIIPILCMGCYSNNNTKELGSYLRIFNKDLNNYKLVCIVPADGCSSCILPTLNFFEQERKSCLLVLSSNFSKSINFILEHVNVRADELLLDYKNIARDMDIVFITAPSIYFVNHGKVINKIDLSEINDQETVFKDIEKHLHK